MEHYVRPLVRHPFGQGFANEPLSAWRIPKALEDLQDDPYRSLAGELIHQGAYAKNDHAFSEFLWADLMRHRIDAALIKADFDAALTKAALLATDEDASNLPGWCGAKDNWRPVGVRFWPLDSSP